MQTDYTSFQHCTLIYRYSSYMHRQLRTYCDKPLLSRINNCAKTFHRAGSKKTHITRMCEHNFIYCLKAIHFHDRIADIAGDRHAVCHDKRHIPLSDSNTDSSELLPRNPGKFRASINNQLLDSH